MTDDREPLAILEEAIESIGLSYQEVMVNLEDGRKVAGYSVVIQNGPDLVELMRRTRHISVNFVPNPITDNQFIAHLRG